MWKPQRNWPLETTVAFRDHSRGLSPKREGGKGWGEEAEREERKREKEGREGGRNEKSMGGEWKDEEEQKLECFLSKYKGKKGHNKLMKDKFVFTEIQSPSKNTLNVK